jgi:translation initiation factor IF-1
MYRICASLQKWRLRLRAADQVKLDMWLVEVRSWMEDYQKMSQAAGREDFFC